MRQDTPYVSYFVGRQNLGNKKLGNRIFDEYEGNLCLFFDWLRQRTSITLYTILERVFTSKKWYNKCIMREKYETDLTDKQWEVIAPLFTNMRKYKWDKRELVNAVLYLVKTGCQWRNLPHDFPPVFTVHSFYRRARLNGLWDKILEHLVKVTRQKAGLSENPTQALIDSQSVKTTGAVDQKGFDMGKKRKE